MAPLSDSYGNGLVQHTAAYNYYCGDTDNALKKVQMSTDYLLEEQYSYHVVSDDQRHYFRALVNCAEFLRSRLNELNWIFCYMLFNLTYKNHFLPSRTG